MILRKYNTPVMVLLLQIDEDTLQEVVKLGFDKNQLIESIQNRMQNEVLC